MHAGRSRLGRPALVPVRERAIRSRAPIRRDKHGMVNAPRRQNCLPEKLTRSLAGAAEYGSDRTEQDTDIATQACATRVFELESDLPRQQHATIKSFHFLRWNLRE